MWLVDEHDQKVAPNTLGQLVVRGPTVMRGYWNKPQATAEKLKDGPIAGEKVLYTGDWGIIDTEGYFYFKGRMDEAFKFNGIKINPLEIEAQINQLRLVKESAVIAITLMNSDTQLIVCAAPMNPEITAPELEANIRKILLRAVHPSHIFMLPQLPKTNNGKIDKLTLQQMAAKLIRGKAVV